MSPKSKRKRRRRGQGTTRFEGLRHRLEASGLLGEREIVSQPIEQEKMSAVLLEFIEPYKHLATTYPAYDRLAGLAVFAWNAAVLKAQGRPDLLLGLMDEAIKAIVPSEDQTARSDLRECLAELIQRKERYFSENQRIIVSYHLSETKRNYRLSVASML